MRLLNIRTRKLESFPASKTPPYAILSHTWGEETEEILFQDVYPDLVTADLIRKAAYNKFWGAVDCTMKLRYKHLWIDTCCIDKTSSAELSEAINSMYRWYQQSEICFTYLVDVRRESFNNDFPRCRWFTRGWTLQELIAPQRVQFYDVDWNYLGTRRDLARDIEKITCISHPILLKDMVPSEVSVSCRMAWAAARVTSRKEDEAYSLMGIFDVNMPLLYGEGDKAFHRLLEEIIRRSNDHTVLLCGVISYFPAKLAILAPTPDCFRQGREFTKPLGSISSHLHIQGNTLQISLLTAPIGRQALGILDSSYANDPTNLSWPALLLEECHGSYTRANMDIYRVTPIDSYTAKVKSGAREFMLELNAVQRRTVTLSLAPVVEGQRALTESTHHMLILDPIIQGRDEYYIYGPCCPSPSEPSGSLLRLLDARFYIEENLYFRGCISLLRPNRGDPCVIIWILEHRSSHPDNTDSECHAAICEMKGILSADSHELFGDEKGMKKLLDKALEHNIPLHHAARHGKASLTTADNVEVSAKIITSQFLERKILYLEVRCAPGKQRNSGPNITAL